MLIGQQIVEKARELIGVPFLHCGRNRHGLDCVGLCLLIGYELGLTDYEPENYSPHVDPDLLRTELNRILDEVSLSEIEPGCIVLTRCTREAYPWHTGVYTGETFIHAFATRGCVVEVSWGQYWLDRTEAVYRWRV